MESSAHLMGSGVKRPGHRADLTLFAAAPCSQLCANRARRRPLPPCGVWSQAANCQARQRSRLRQRHAARKRSLTVKEGNGAPVLYPGLHCKEKPFACSHRGRFARTICGGAALLSRAELR